MDSVKANMSLSQEVINLSLQLIVLLGTQPVRGFVGGNSTLYRVDFEFDTPFRRSTLQELF